MLPVLYFEFNTRLSDRATSGLRFMNTVTKIKSQFLSDHLHEMETGLATGRFEEETGRASELQNLHLLVDHDGRRNIFGIKYIIISLFKAIGFGQNNNKKTTTDRHHPE